MSNMLCTLCARHTAGACLLWAELVHLIRHLKNFFVQAWLSQNYSRDLFCNHLEDVVILTNLHQN